MPHPLDMALILRPRERQLPHGNSDNLAFGCDVATRSISPKSAAVATWQLALKSIELPHGNSSLHTHNWPISTLANSALNSAVAMWQLRRKYHARQQVDAKLHLARNVQLPHGNSSGNSASCHIDALLNQPGSPAVAMWQQRGNLMQLPCGNSPKIHLEFPMFGGQPNG